MNSDLPTRALTFMVLLAAGFGAGWWARGLDAAASPTERRVASGWGTPAATGTGLSGTAQVDGQMSSPRRDIAAEIGGADPIGNAQKAKRNPSGEPLPSERFRALLDKRAFTAAMDVYVRVERTSGPSEAAELKGVALSYLQSYLSNGDGASLTALVDAFLSRYYDDIDVLLVLAKHHARSDYPSEAARTFQLAMTYAYSAADQQKVGAAFRAFVQDVDDRFAAQTQWQELIGFYESLDLLDLSQPHYQLRLAQLYLAHGEAYSGRDLLERLLSEPAVAAEAHAILQKLDAGQEPAPVQAPMDFIALGVAGTHFHLPLRLNDEAEVRLIIDTGASTTTITRQKFDEINRYGNFTEVGPQVFNTASGVTKGTVYLADEFRIGKHVLNNVHIAVLEFEMAPGLDGLLGMNVLSKFRFQVEQDEQRLYLRPR